MYTLSELRAIARKSLSGAWGMAVLVMLILYIVSGVIGYIPYVGPFVIWLIAGPLALGVAAYFLRTVRGERPELPVMFSGFQNFGSAFLLYLLMAVLVFLWSLLLVIPGIIAALRYSMAYFILNDNPNMSPIDAIRASGDMMRGQKGRLFLLGLSFIGWAILCIPTFGIGYLWLGPYMYTSYAAFYEELRTRQSGFTAPEDPAHPTAAV